MNVELIATAFGIPSLLGILVLLAGRGRSWTVPVWAFLVAPWVGLAGWFVCFVAARVGDRAAPVGAGAPIMGPMGGLAAMLTLIAMLGLGLLVTIVALLVPPPRAWTRRSAGGGLAAANLSIAWSLFLGAIDPESLPHDPSDAFTIEVSDGFQGRVWIFEDEASGTPPRWLLGSARYTVPSDGVLVTTDAGPIRDNRGFDRRGVTIRMPGGGTVPWASKEDVARETKRRRAIRGKGPWWEARLRPAPSPCWNARHRGAYSEVLVGDPEWMERRWRPPDDFDSSGMNSPWWSDRADVLFRPQDSTVDGVGVMWRHVSSQDGRHEFETTRTPADGAAGSLHFTYAVAPDPQRSRRMIKLGVRNIGTETVDGWKLSFLTPFKFLMNGRYTYYIQSVGVEELVPFAPLNPQPAARHEFFRVPGSRPLAPGDEEEFCFVIYGSLIEHQPTLEWARSLRRPAR